MKTNILQFWRASPTAIWNNVLSQVIETRNLDLSETARIFALFYLAGADASVASGHTTNSGAMAKILELIFDDDPGVALVVTMSGITRQWDKFSQGVEEVIDARIYSGFHFRTADEVGARQGRQVARFVFMHALKPCRKGGSRCS